MCSYMYTCLDVSGYIVTTCFAWVRVETTLLEAFFQRDRAGFPFRKCFSFDSEKKRRCTWKPVGEVLSFCAFGKVHHAFSPACLGFCLFLLDVFWGENLYFLCLYIYIDIYCGLSFPEAPVSSLQDPPFLSLLQTRKPEKKNTFFVQAQGTSVKTSWRRCISDAPKQKTVKCWHKSCGTTKIFGREVGSKVSIHHTKPSCSVTFC